MCNKNCGDDREQELRIVGRDCLEPRPELLRHEVGQREPAPECTEMYGFASRYRCDTQRHVPLDGRRQPEAVGARAVVLELRQRRHGLHHDRCDRYGRAERPYSRHAAARTHDVALAVHVDHSFFWVRCSLWLLRPYDCNLTRESFSAVLALHSRQSATSATMPTRPVVAKTRRADGS